MQSVNSHVNDFCYNRALIIAYNYLYILCLSIISFPTYNNEMPHCLEAKSLATSKSPSPMREIVGATANGPMKRIMKPTIPVVPITTWAREATIMAPWICGEQFVILTYVQSFMLKMQKMQMDIMKSIYMNYDGNMSSTIELLNI